jgi:O-Antigen ligase
MRAAAAAVLLVGPTVLAFYTGGYFDAARITAGLIAWALVALAALICPGPLARAGAARLALLGLGGLAAWTLVSITWAPVAGTAYHDGQRLVLYAGALLAALMLLRGRAVQRAVEPALAAGATVVVGYGLAERLLPGLLHYARSASAQGRLEQPLTYWNAMGELAAIGLVIATRLAGDRARPRPLRALAAAAVAPLGVGLYTSFSRGALFACAAGLVTLIVAAPARAQARSLALAVASAILAVAAAAPFAGVTGLSGSLATRELQGAVALVLLAALMALAALVQLRLAAGDPDGSIQLPSRAPALALAVICVGFAAAVIAGAHESSGGRLAPGATRYVSLQSNRYAYWRVALRAFAAQPLRGVGAGGWAVWWLRYRPFNEGAQDAHSLELQTAAELGLVGLALLAAFLAGIALAARTALARAPLLAAGPVAGFVVWVAHSPLDWDWEMPAVTLVALILGGLLLALGDA